MLTAHILYFIVARKHKSSVYFYISLLSFALCIGNSYNIPYL